MEGTTATAKAIPPPLQMLQIISGFWIGRCVYVLAKLGLADLIKDEPKSVLEDALRLYERKGNVVSAARARDVLANAVQTWQTPPP